MHFVLLILPQQNAFCFVDFCTNLPTQRGQNETGSGCRACFCTGKRKLKTDVYALFLYSSYSGTTKEAEMKRVQAVEPVFASLAMSLDAEVFQGLV
jgi:hypothetical protein